MIRIREQQLIELPSPPLDEVELARVCDNLDLVDETARPMSDADLVAFGCRMLVSDRTIVFVRGS